MAISREELNDRTDAERYKLIRDVYDWVIDNTESLEVQDIGADLAYLIGAIAHANVCEWSKNRPFVRLLLECRDPAVYAAFNYVEATWLTTNVQNQATESTFPILLQLLRPLALRAIGLSMSVAVHAGDLDRC